MGRSGRDTWNATSAEDVLLHVLVQHIDDRSRLVQRDEASIR